MSMQAAFVKVPFQVELREVSIPEVKPGWALIHVKACGICGTDMHIGGMLADEWQGFGHEIAGVVAKVGAGVTHVKEGDAVALESGSYCGECDLCRNGRVDLCNKAPKFWRKESMGFAEYILAPKACIVPFDSNNLSFEVACLAEPLGVALDMTYVADIRLGDEVLVLGLGAIGLMAIPLARMQGAGRIYAFNRSGGKRAELAKAYGADTVITHDTLGDVQFRKGGVDRALVSAPPSTLTAAMQVMNYGGIISFIGIEYGPGATISFDANDFHFNKTQLRASHASPGIYLPRVLQLLQDKHVDGEAIISHRLPLAQIEQGLTLMRDHREDVLKVVITP